MRATASTTSALLTAATLLISGCGTAEQPQPPRAMPEPSTTIGPVAHDPAAPTDRSGPIPAAALRGVEWLVAAQSNDGGWGQDGATPRDGTAQESTGTDVANTALAALALLRSGTTPTAGPHREQLLAAAGYIMRSIEAAPDEGLAITDKQNTQIQRKLGPFVDTFVSAMLLGELMKQMPDAASERRLVAALDKCVDKIEKNQQQDGSWNAGGWAPIINTSMASRSLFAAQNKGIDVDTAVLQRVDEYTMSQFDAKTKNFKIGEGDAGVHLYKVAQALEQASRTPADAEKREVMQAAGGMVSSETFQAGFGSMGGEEFISYMNISDSLARAGGSKWEEWNGDIKQRLEKLQNADGTWAGHHCITGRVACTSAAILTMLTDRTVETRVAGIEGK